MENLDTLVKVYTQKLGSDKLEDYLLKNYNEPYKEQFGEIYEKNRLSLNNYRFWKTRTAAPLPDFDSLNVKILTEGKGIYYSINIETHNTPPPPQVVDNGNNITRAFFRDLSKPLLVTDEFNRAHFEYLENNVRRSEDFGGDNHIYAHYTSLELFCLLLQTIDLTPFLAREKFIFLIGDETDTLYPLDFKSEYGIDYDARESQPVRLDELNRLLIAWHTIGSNGTTFLSTLLDSHPNCINIKVYGGDFPEFYHGVLEGKSVAEMAQALRVNKDRYVYAYITYLLNPNDRDVKGVCPVPTYEGLVTQLFKIFPGDYKPSMGEWLKGLVLAYSYALGRDLNARVAPAVFFYDHRYIAGGPLLPLMKEAIEHFKYVRAVSPIRRITSGITSGIRNGFRANKGVVQTSQVGNLSFPPLNYLNLTEEKSGLDSKSYLLKPNDKYLKVRRIVRFEDLKLQPKATLEALCDWFDIPWSDTLLKTSINGVTEYYGGTSVTGFDKTPLYRRYEEFLSHFDGYRLEMLVLDLMKIYGYKPIFYTDGEKYSVEEIEEMFRVHFKMMRYFTNFPDNMLNIKEDMISRVKKRILQGCFKDAAGNDLVPIPMLKPKPEFVQGELYE